MPICDEDVQPAAVVEVYESGSPLYVGIAGLRSFGGPSHVCKALRAQVAKQVIGLIGEISDVDTEAPVVTVVAEVNAH